MRIQKTNYKMVTKEQYKENIERLEALRGYL